MPALLVLAGVVVAWRPVGGSPARHAAGAPWPRPRRPSRSRTPPASCCWPGCCWSPWLRRDRERGRCGDGRRGVVVTAVVFAPVALDRRRPDLLPRTSLRWVTTTVNEQLAPCLRKEWLVIALLVVGGTLLIRRGGPQARVARAVRRSAARPRARQLPRAPPPAKSVLSLSWGVVLALGARRSRLEAPAGRQGSPWRVARPLLHPRPHVWPKRARTRGGRMAATVSAQAVDSDVVAVRPENLGTLSSVAARRIEGRCCTGHHAMGRHGRVAGRCRAADGPHLARGVPDRVLRRRRCRPRRRHLLRSRAGPRGREFLLSCLDDVPVEDAGG